MPTPPSLLVFVYTGDRKHAGTDNTVHLVLHCDEDMTSSQPINLNTSFGNELERAQIDCFRVSAESVKDLDRFVKIGRLEIWKKSTLGIFASDWFVDKIVVENCTTNVTYVFPFFRWIKSGYHYHIKHLDTTLPQFEEFTDQRKKELAEKRTTYQFHQRLPNGPAQVKDLPPDEEFSFDYKWDIKKTGYSLGMAGKFSMMCSERWKTIEDINKIYESEAFERPKSEMTWKDDIAFGRQRVASMNSSLIRVAKVIPEKFPVTDELVGPLLEGMTLEDALAKKKLFIIDLHILEGIPVRKGFTLCKPIALFYLDKNQTLLPIAIQLFQLPTPNNPIFTPLDPELTWSMVKMWYNNADAAYHQSLTHLGPTHLLMEGFAVAMHRNLSPSHPVFKIMAPHFLYLIAINWKGLPALLSEGGWTEKVMTYGSKGMQALILKGFNDWRLGVEGLLPEELKSRGFEDPSILPNYYFRDDALLIYNAIRKYVKSYVDLYYTSPEMFMEDSEIQDWAQELVKEKKTVGGGAGYKEVPGNGEITCSEDLVKILTCVIYTCSVAHAAANFPQYDEYSFPPNYPMVLHGIPPTSKSETITQQDILESLPDERTTFDIMTITGLLSSKGTNSLGDFEVQYIFDPKALSIVEEFREDLKEIDLKIKERNSQATHPYDYLEPENIPNSISI